MKITQKTIDVLKNFAGINQSLYVDAMTKKLSTISVDKNIIGYAEIEEEFPVEFGLYDLNEFLSAVSLFNDPSFELNEKYMIVSDASGNSLSYRYVAKEIVVSPPKVVKFPEPELEVVLSKELIGKIIRSSSVLSAPEFIFTVRSGKVVVAVADSKNDASNSFEIPVCDYKGSDEFNLILKVENLKLQPLEYVVQISSRGISRWTNDENGVEYYIALDRSSEFNPS